MWVRLECFWVPWWTSARAIRVLEPSHWLLALDVMYRTPHQRGDADIRDASHVLQLPMAAGILATGRLACFWHLVACSVFSLRYDSHWTGAWSTFGRLAYVIDQPNVAELRALPWPQHKVSSRFGVVMPFTDTPDAHALTACMFCAKQIPELDLQELPCMIRSHLALICIPDYTILYRSNTLIISYPCRIKRDQCHWLALIPDMWSHVKPCQVLDF